MQKRKNKHVQDFEITLRAAQEDAQKTLRYLNFAPIWMPHDLTDDIEENVRTDKYLMKGVNYYGGYRGKHFRKS